eukprot:1186916-Ditylum_brightwellii.AAC.1
MERDEEETTYVESAMKYKSLKVFKDIVYLQGLPNHEEPTVDKKAKSRHIKCYHRLAEDGKKNLDCLEVD